MVPAPGPERGVTSSPCTETADSHGLPVSTVMVKEHAAQQIQKQTDSISFFILPLQHQLNSHFQDLSPHLSTNHDKHFLPLFLFFQTLRLHVHFQCHKTSILFSSIPYCSTSSTAVPPLQQYPIQQYSLTPVSSTALSLAAISPLYTLC